MKQQVLFEGSKIDGGSCFFPLKCPVKKDETGIEKFIFKKSYCYAGPCSLSVIFYAYFMGCTAGI